MSIFQDVTFEWRGEEYTVQADRVMRLIATVEEYIRIPDLTNRQGPALSRLAAGYAAALHFAGCRPAEKGTPLEEEVYSRLFCEGASEVSESATLGLLTMMLPPDSYSPKKKTKRKKAKTED